jgi:signal peptidase II
MSESHVVQSRPLSRALYAAVAVTVFFGDQLTKRMVEDAIPEHAVIPIFPSFLNLTHVKNPGAAFGLFADSPAPWKTFLLVAISVAVLAIVIRIVLKSPALAWPSGVGLALIAGGAVSNLLDRVRDGRVVDFLDIFVGPYHWPAFNLADSAIVVGAGFVILHLLHSD